MKRQFLAVPAAVAVSLAGCNQSAEADSKAIEVPLSNTTQVVQSPETAQESDSVLENRVKQVIAEQLGVKENVSTKANIRDDLGADSLDTAELIMALEKEFEIEIPDEDAEKIRTVGDVIEYIRTRMGLVSRNQSVKYNSYYIRYARLSDLGQIAQITARSWQETHTQLFAPELLHMGTVEFFRDRWTKLLETSDQETSCLVLDHKSRIVGVGACGPYRLNSSLSDELLNQFPHEGRFGELFRGYLEPSLTMRTAAELMFSACMQRLLEHGFSKVVLWTQSTNDPMRRFAESMGGVYVTSTRHLK